MNSIVTRRRFRGMKNALISLALGAALILASNPAAADCYADYKAKRDNPLNLHYGVMQLPDSACASVDAASPVIAQRIAADGWTLLNVVSLFGADGLTEKRKTSAGEYFLRY